MLLVARGFPLGLRNMFDQDHWGKTVLLEKSQVCLEQETSAFSAEFAQVS